MVYTGRCSTEICGLQYDDLVAYSIQYSSLDTVQWSYTAIDAYSGPFTYTEVTAKLTFGKMRTYGTSRPPGLRQGGTIRNQ